MSEQEFQRIQRESVVSAEETVEQTTDAPFDVDALLDDIDSILETNASSFVQGFVQKGGQ
ncbi:ubiquitin-like protein Pup [Arcanobacterium phocisimile]|uniref:Prokaryotic ubiquitin-like protein Pup n=1 Tax=Arcanobacterium phocisimile TaxID=1302235 RepID=A0ABX7IEX5_9ACTO|nr:ubiquitin-like protein Pup [Arcanobacterium phocisimile]QRV01405.1 ubiquitin-like protein Pup [Arcanobacterium phocisimile]